MKAIKRPLNVSVFLDRLQRVEDPLKPIDKAEFAHTNKRDLFNGLKELGLEVQAKTGDETYKYIIKDKFLAQF